MLDSGWITCTMEVHGINIPLMHASFENNFLDILYFFNLSCQQTHEYFKKHLKYCWGWDNGLDSCNKLFTHNLRGMRKHLLQVTFLQLGPGSGFTHSYGQVFNQHIDHLFCSHNEMEYTDTIIYIPNCMTLLWCPLRDPWHVIWPCRLMYISCWWSLFMYFISPWSTDWYEVLSYWYKKPLRIYALHKQYHRKVIYESLTKCKTIYLELLPGNAALFKSNSPRSIIICKCNKEGLVDIWTQTKKIRIGFFKFYSHYSFWCEECSNYKPKCFHGNKGQIQL